MTGILIALMIAPLSGQAPAPVDPQVERELVRLEAVWNEAHLEHDADTLDRLWAEELTVVVPEMAPMTKEEGLALTRSGRMAFDRYETSELSVRRYGDTALVAGRMFRSRRVGVRTFEDRWRFLKVYVRQSNEWRVVAFQASMADQ